MLYKLRSSIANIMRLDICVAMLLFVVSFPLIIFTFDTGWFSDDYQFLHLFQAKLDISNHFFRDIITPRTDYHLLPFFHLFNYLVLSIDTGHRWFHTIVLASYIGSGFMVFLIVKNTHRARWIGILAAVIFVISYDISIKSLVFHNFHYNATNTFTGLIATYFAVRYLIADRISYLAVVGVALLCTVFNYESGLIFLVIIGSYSIFSRLKGRVETRSVVNILIVLVLVLGAYASLGFYTTGKIFPIFLNRIGTDHQTSMMQGFYEERNPDNETLLFKKLTKNRLTVGEEDHTSISVGDLGAGELRSTYAPRDVTVYVIRAFDLAEKIVNFTVVEKIIKNIVISKRQVAEGDAAYHRYKKYQKFLLILGGIVVVFLTPIVGFYLYGFVSEPSKVFLLILIVISAIFVFVYNRVDIANSVAIFSSVVVADIIYRLWLAKSHWKRVTSRVMVAGVAFGPVLNMVNQFEEIYPFNKNLMYRTGVVYEQINDQLGQYSEDVVVYVHDESVIAQDWMRYDHPVIFYDLAHLNFRRFQNQITEDEDLVSQYRDISLEKFAHDSEINDNISVMLVESEADINSNQKKRSDQITLSIYVNKESIATLYSALN